MLEMRISCRVSWSQEVDVAVEVSGIGGVAAGICISGENWANCYGALEPSGCYSENFAFINWFLCVLAAAAAATAQKNDFPRSMNLAIRHAFACISKICRSTALSAAKSSVAFWCHTCHTYPLPAEKDNPIEQPHHEWQLVVEFSITQFSLCAIWAWYGVVVCGVCNRFVNRLVNGQSINSNFSQFYCNIHKRCSSSFIHNLYRSHLICYPSATPNC